MVADNLEDNKEDGSAEKRVERPRIENMVGECEEGVLCFGKAEKCVAEQTLTISQTAISFVHLIIIMNTASLRTLIRSRVVAEVSTEWDATGGQPD